MDSELLKYYFGFFICSYTWHLMHIFTIYISSLSETEDSLPPGKAVYYTWADPVGSRKLKWKCEKGKGEVPHKVVCTGLVIMVFSTIIFFLSSSLSVLLVLRPLCVNTCLKLTKIFNTIFNFNLAKTERSPILSASLFASLML